MTMAAPKKTASGEHPEVRAMKAEMRSIRENLGGRINRMNAKLEHEVRKIRSDRPTDPRRESDDPIPIDVVRIPRGPRPSQPEDFEVDEPDAREVPRP